ncbi:SPFH domain-containing protein [Candidatus Clostridium stratigraminis]|uniref:SPFH domain-containing protein n=1 Tax=Candidatus Clostridium stratigraminis TaxID=3381661 RepID=A0ABW8T9Y9_9CLOT
MANIAKVIKYEGDNSTFIWKHNCEDFNNYSQLIVHESQEAILFRNGQALDLFGPGRHTLESQNIPILGRLINKVSNDETPFHCEIYFVNMVEQMSLKWGTDSKVQYMEPAYKFPISIGASGEMSVCVDDSRKLLLKLVGTEKELSQSKIINIFRAFLMTRVKTYMATVLTQSAISIFEIDMYLEQFSEQLKVKLEKDFRDYGLKLNQFLVTTVSRPDGELQYEKLKELHFRKYADITDAQIRQQKELIDQQTRSMKMQMEAEALANKRKTEGYDYQTERAYNAVERLAKNEGVGNFSNAGLGLGMMGGIGVGVGQGVAGLAANALNPVFGAISSSPTTPTVPEVQMPPTLQLREDTIQEPVSSQEISKANSMTAFKEKIDMLNMMKDSGLMSAEEFEAERQQLMKMIRG